MFKRSMLSLLLIASIVTISIGRPVGAQEEVPDQAKTKALAPDEEREARALAEEFIDRLEKSADVSPLVKELYVDGFPDRLRNHMESLFPLAVTPEVAAQMSSDEILRAYAASINLMYMASRLISEHERRLQQVNAKRDGTAEKAEAQELTILEIIPPSVLKLIQSDPLLAAVLDEMISQEKEERRSNDGERDAGNSSTSEADVDQSPSAWKSLDDIWPFRSLDDFHRYLSLAEQGAKLLREHIDSLPPQLKTSITEFRSASSDRSTDEEANESRGDLTTRPHVLESEWMGYPDGTHIICAEILIFHVDMVRSEDGHLKVVSAYLITD